MVNRAQPVKSGSGIIAAALVAALIFATLAAVFMRAEHGTGFTRADYSVLRFTLVQATLSAVISVALAVPVARALARRRFFGRGILITVMGAPFILPVIVAVLGLLAVFGRAGWLNQITGFIGLPPVQIYGLHGVVLAHVFFNLPLATRLILQAWQEIPAERFRLAAQLGFGPRAMFRQIEYPLLRRVVPGALAVIFALCLSSFAVALTLGGGPRATTIELAIYQAFRFDFDLARAALLSLTQLGLTILAALMVLQSAGATAFDSGPGRAVRRWDGKNLTAKLFDMACIALAAVFLMLPLAAVILAGLRTLPDVAGLMLWPVLISLSIALISTAILLLLALPMAVATALGRGAGLLETAGLLGLAASPLVIGTGLFILIRPIANPTALALPVTALVNAVMALPFALRILIPRAREVIRRHGRLALSLGMAGGPFIRRILLPRMRPQIGFAAGLSAALSMGDLGVIALFADPDFATLPLQIYRLMGAYRMADAAGAALMLLFLSLTIFWLFDRGGRWHAEA